MQVHIEELGDSENPTLIMIHGAGGSSATWFMQLRGLYESIHVIAIDLNGHGKSKDSDQADTLESYLEDVRSVVDEVESPYLMGHSMGGAITQLFALRNPKLLSGIILVGTGSRLKVHPMIFDLLRNDFEGYVEALGSFMFDTSTSEKIVDSSKAEVRKCSPRIIERDFLACNEFDIMESVASIDLPTLIIVGENDQMTPIKYSKYLNDKIEGSKMRVIPNAGHGVMLEKADEVNQIVLDWISSLK